MIPAKGHSAAKVSFYPYTDKPSGEVCTAYAAAYMSLDQQIRDTDHIDWFITLDSRLGSNIVNTAEKKETFEEGNAYEIVILSRTWSCLIANARTRTLSLTACASIKFEPKLVECFKVFYRALIVADASSRAVF